MRTVLCLLVWEVVGSIAFDLPADWKPDAEIGKVGSIFDLKQYGDILLDDDDRRDYSDLELKAIEYMHEYSMSRSWLALLVSPYCEYDDWMYPSCCTTIEILDFPHEICIDMALEWRELKVSMALNHNGETLFSFEFVLGEICVGVPYMGKISLCGHLYHIDVKTQPKLFLRACLTVKLKALIDTIELRFYCLDATQEKDGALLEQQWSFKQSTEIEPANKGMIAILIKNDKIALEFNNPIPPELVQAFKTAFNTAVEVINNAVVVVKKAVVNAYNSVARAVTSAASNAWRAIKGFFG